jgi:hypothetical protein
MNMNELLLTWKAYDQKLAASTHLQEQLIKNMIRERSGSTLASIRRHYVRMLLMMGGVIAFCTLSVLYNAFDYTHPIQHVSLILYILAALGIAYLVLKAYSATHVDLYHDHLASSLQKSLASHTAAMAAKRKVWFLFLLAGFLYPVTMMPRIIEHRGLLVALGLVGFGAVSIWLLLLLFKYLGAFTDRHGDSLRACLRELEELSNSHPEGGLPPR